MLGSTREKTARHQRAPCSPGQLPFLHSGKMNCGKARSLEWAEPGGGRKGEGRAKGAERGGEREAVGEEAQVETGGEEPEGRQMVGWGKALSPGDSFTSTFWSLQPPENQLD